MTSGPVARFAVLLIASATTVLAQGTAMVEGDRVNVRGGAGTEAEVVTQLRKGETVVVLDTITLSKPGKGEPANWLKILLPANTPVWVNTHFISSSNTVAGSKLNVRGGPGENYSVLARLVKGDVVEPIRTVDDWIEIHPPTNAVAYVVASLLSVKGDLPAATAPKVEATVVETIPDKPAPVAAVPPVPKPTETTVVESAPLVAAVESKPKAPETPPVAEPAAPVVAAPVVAAPVVAAPVVPPTESAPVEITPAAPRRRIVVREGILRRDFNVNTPGYFQLVDKYHGRLINYLYVSNPELDLGPFVGSVVIVRGEEYLDARWKRTPVIEVEHATLPN
jgi:SH3-like domain-containing protein